MSGNEQQIDQLAKKLLLLSRNTLLVHLRFLDIALSQFSWVPVSGYLATDGSFIYYDPRQLLQSYLMEKERPVRNYLHMVLHCVFQHSFVDNLIDHDCWNLACDIAVEATISQLQIQATLTANQEAQSKVLTYLRNKIKYLTAEKIYRYYLEHRPSSDKFFQLQSLFYVDSHDIWYSSSEPEADTSATHSQSNPSENHLRVSHCSNKHSNDSYNHPQISPATSPKQSDTESNIQTQPVLKPSLNRLPSFSKSTRSELTKVWKEISQKIQIDLETFSINQGKSADDLIQNLRTVNREKYDYTSFLKKFSVLGEVMKTNEDEFDYIFYTYGLQLYQNIPLIEPLEYKETKAIKEFIIAIDTSGSTSGEIVQNFVQKTYNILKSTESFFSKINLHIIQCDAKIQEDVKISCQKDFDEYLQTMSIKGQGGTDFRPVFDYVEQLRQKKELINLKGLIYLTDGFGTFPAKKPDYQAAFIFIAENDNNLKVPSWAIKLVLQKDEI